MIQIINKTDNYKITCSQCDSEFTYNFKDITKNYYEQKIIVCPCCGSKELHSRREKLQINNDQNSYIKTIQILSRPEYLDWIISKFYDGVGVNYQEERILKETFKPYWRPDIGVKELLELKDKYNLSDLDLKCIDTIDGFTESIECGGIMSFDGYGEFIIGDERLPITKFTVDECKEMESKGCQYVFWYNK